MATLLTAPFLVDVLTLIVIGLLVYAALHDFAARTVPNMVSVIILFLGAGIRAIEHNMLVGFAIALASFVCLLPLWLLGVVGGGDVKLWTAMALVLPPTVPDQIGFILSVFVLGGLLAIVYLGLRMIIPQPSFAGVRQGSLPVRVLRAEAWRISHRGPLPYAMAIAAGGFLILAEPMLNRVGV
ncbi:MAG TPA: prepilin peptidase [Acidiphilium sp.]|nr:MAG: hypothetical protein B7Z67_07835 [Acidiphilium sp. 21-60-14]OYV91809.1 MAG: hypothetical protein B7Z57_03095 [Acidiphilium sp. 37-60-79]OZB41287.1 MAG: hypothetical protein B7X48_01200 [Acidiphilium sp. 34-60-192]HQT89221.1 prepilin peptidase [Acidiphilium sp.]HQU25125.1 prepilin peptidase [Acidiphilium sp.]